MCTILNFALAMTGYRRTLQYLYEQLPMYQRQGAKAFRKDLSNSLALDAMTGHPHRNFPSIHVAGTNGKGSTCHMIASVLTAAGYNVGLYTSPHLRDFRERIRIDGKLMDKAAVVEFVETYRSQIGSLGASFFEITVAMAMWYFSREKVDVAIIETGLGGRLDSTNIIRPVLCLITNIGWDHMNFLGDTLPAIAAEKAGIIKPGVPVVISETQPETRPVFEEKAAQLGAPIHFAGDSYRVRQVRLLKRSAQYRVWEGGVLRYRALNVQAQGEYQERNLAGVLQAVDLLRSGGQFEIPEHAMLHGLRSLRRLSGFQGRWQWIGKNPRTLCDAAHNESGLALAMEQLERVPREKLHMVVGFVNDKELGKMLKLLPQDALYYFVRPDIPRGLGDVELAALAVGYGLEGVACGSVAAGLSAARKAAAPDDLVYVGGSCFVVAEVV